MKVPAQYAKFIAAVIGEAIAYIQLYGLTWHLQPALVMAGAALGVYAVPNAPKPAPPSNLTAGPQVPPVPPPVVPPAA